MLELKLDDGRLYQERVKPEDYEERLEFLQRLFHQEKVLVELNFIYCLVGNIVEERIDKTRNITVKGKKHFSPGTKVYCYPPQWGDGYEKVKVIGLHRNSHKLITIVMPSKHIINWRLKTVYHPLIIKEMKATGGWLNKESHKEDILTMASSLNKRKPSS